MVAHSRVPPGPVSGFLESLMVSVCEKTALPRGARLKIHEKRAFKRDVPSPLLGSTPTEGRIESRGLVGGMKLLRASGVVPRVLGCTWGARAYRLLHLLVRINERRQRAEILALVCHLFLSLALVLFAVARGRTQLGLELLALIAHLDQVILRAFRVLSVLNRARA